MAIYHQDIADIELNSGSILRTFLKRSIGLADAAANRFGVRVFRDGEPETLSGVTCQGFFKNADGVNIALTSYGTIDGNVAYVTLPAACYNVEGRFTLAIKLVGSDVTGTMRIVDGNVDNTNTSSPVAPTGSVPTYQEVLSVFGQMQDALEDYDETVATQNAQISDLKSAITAVGSDEYSSIQFVTYSGFVMRTNGGISSSSNLNHTDYIDITLYSKLKYKRKGVTSSTTSSAMAFYDANKTFISSVQDAVSQQSDGYQTQLYVVNVPENAKYARFTTYKNTGTYGNFEVYGYSRNSKIISAILSEIELINDGEKETSTIIQGRYYYGNFEESDTRCAFDKTYYVYPNDIVSVSGTFDGIKYVIAIAYDDGTLYESGWITFNYAVHVTKGGILHVNFAKTNGTDTISPSEVSALLRITSPVQDNFSEINKRIDFGHGYIDFSQEEGYYSSSHGTSFGYNKGQFYIAGNSTDSTVVRLTKQYQEGRGNDFIKSFEDGLSLKPGGKYRLTSKLYKGNRIADGIKYGITFSVYIPGGSGNIGAFTAEEDAIINDFIAPQDGIVNICMYINADSLFDDCRGFVVLEEIKDEEEIIKEYYESEMADTVSKIRKNNDEIALVFPCVTDIHRFKASVQTFPDMINNMKEIAKKVKCDFFLNTGDTIEGDKTQDISLGQAYDSIASFASIREPFFYVNGNHDNNPYISSGALVFNLKQVYGGFFAATKNVIFNANENGTDYYFDYPNIGVRFISINSCNSTIAINYGFGNSTAAWLEQALDTDHTVIIATHVSPIKEHVWNNINPGNANAVRNVLSNFVNNGGKLILITGHSHIDAEFVNPYVEVTNVCQKFETADITSSGYLVMSGMIDGLRNPDRTANTYTTDAWTVCVYKPISNELDLIRFGAGVDRYIHCTPVSSGTLTTRFSSATWATTDSSVATVSNGTVTVVGTGRCAIVAKDSAGNIEVWVVES